MHIENKHILSRWHLTNTPNRHSNSPTIQWTELLLPASTHQDIMKVCLSLCVWYCGQTLFPYSLHTRFESQTHTEKKLKWVSQSNTLPVSRTHKHSPSRGEESGRAPARLYGGTECSELLHSATTLHGSTIQSP